jgi:TonB family protein
MTLVLALLFCLFQNNAPDEASSCFNKSGSVTKRGVTRLKPDELKARIISCAAPHLAGNMDASGTVFVEIVVDNDGRVQCARPITGEPIISRPALEAVKKWRFTPLRVNGSSQPFAGFLPVYVGWNPDEAAKNCPADNEAAAIRAVIEAQAAAWNRGDVEGYMDGYDRSPNTEFVSGDNITRGWQQVLDRYKKRYDTRDKMGVLTFSELEITVLSDSAALVLGRWHLKRTSDEPHGTFTLLFRKTNAGWRIVHDHTSSAS